MCLNISQLRPHWSLAESLHRCRAIEEPSPPGSGLVGRREVQMGCQQEGDREGVVGGVTFLAARLRLRIPRLSSLTSPLSPLSSVPHLSHLTSLSSPLSPHLSLLTSLTSPLSPHLSHLTSLSSVLCPLCLTSLTSPLSPLFSRHPVFISVPPTFLASAFVLVFSLCVYESSHLLPTLPQVSKFSPVFLPPFHN